MIGGKCAEIDGLIEGARQRAEGLSSVAPGYALLARSVQKSSLMARSLAAKASAASSKLAVDSVAPSARPTSAHECPALLASRMDWPSAFSRAIRARQHSATPPIGSRVQSPEMRRRKRLP